MWKSGFHKKNFIFLWLRDGLAAAAASFTSNAVFSAFFLKSGLTEKQISIYLALVPMVNLLVSLWFSGAASHERNSIRKASIFCAASGCVTALYALLCIGKMPSALFYACVLLLGSGFSFVTAIRVVYEYKVPCEVIEKEEFSVYQSVSGIVCGIFGITAGIFVSQLYISALPFLPVTAGIFLAAGICLVLAAVSNCFLTVIHNSEVNSDAPVRLFETAKTVFSDHNFQRLIAPNFIRGVGAGIVGILPIIASTSLGLNTSEISLINVYTYVATLIGCFLYAILSKKIGALLSGLVGGLLFCALIGAFSGGIMRFYILFCLSYIGYNIVCYVIPEIIFRSTPPEAVSAVQTWRMVLTTLGTSVSSVVFGSMIGKIPTFVMVLIGVLSVMYCIVSYYYCYKQTNFK